MTMFAERGGVSSRDIIRISMGADTNTRVMAVKTGAAQATTVDPGGLVFAQKEGLVSLGFLGDLFPCPFRASSPPKEKSGKIQGKLKDGSKERSAASCSSGKGPRRRWIWASKNFSSATPLKPMLVEATKNYLRALAPGVPGLPTSEGIKNFLEYDIKIPLQIKEDISPERLLSLQLVEEVKKDLENTQRRTSR